MSHGCTCATGSLDGYLAEIDLPASVGCCEGLGTCGTSISGGFLDLPASDFGGDAPAYFGATCTAPATIALNNPDGSFCIPDSEAFDGCSETNRGFGGWQVSGFELGWYGHVVNGVHCSDYTFIDRTIFRCIPLVTVPPLGHPAYGTWAYIHLMALVVKWVGRWAHEPTCVSNAKFTFVDVSENWKGSNSATEIPCCTRWRGKYDLGAGKSDANGPCGQKLAVWSIKPTPCTNIQGGSLGGSVGLPAFTPGVTVASGGPS